MTKAKAPAAKLSARMTLAEVAALVVERHWPNSPAAEKRAHRDRVRKRVLRAVDSGKLTRSVDGTFSRSRIEVWEQSIRWRGVLVPFAEIRSSDGTRELIYLGDRGQLIRQDGQRVRLRLKGELQYAPQKKPATLDECHAEITRLGAQRDRLHNQLSKERREIDELNAKLAKLAKTDAKREGGRKGAERRWRKSKV